MKLGLPIPRASTDTPYTTTWGCREGRGTRAPAASVPFRFAAFQRRSQQPAYPAAIPSAPTGLARASPLGLARWRGRHPETRDELGRLGEVDAHAAEGRGVVARSCGQFRHPLVRRLRAA